MFVFTPQQQCFHHFQYFFIENIFTQRVNVFLVYLIIIFFSFEGLAQVGINIDSPHPSSVLEISSDEKGVLIPRVSKTDRETISNPAYGLMVYDTDSQSFWYYKKGSVAPDIDRWEEVGKNSLQSFVKYQDPNGLTIGPNMGFPDHLLSIYFHLKFSEKIIDSQNEFDPSTSAFTANQDGFYSIYAQCIYNYNSSATNQSAIGIFKKELATDIMSMIAEGYSYDDGGISMRATHTLVDLKKGDQIYFGVTLPAFMSPLSEIKSPQTQFTIHQIE